MLNDRDEALLYYIKDLWGRYSLPIEQQKHRHARGILYTFIDHDRHFCQLLLAMYDANAPAAQHALLGVADWGQRSSSQLSMPSPNVANNKSSAAKKSPEKPVDLGPSLAKKRSQEFAGKIAGWHQAGGGIVQKQDEVVVMLEEEGDSEDGTGLPAGVQVEENGKTTDRSRSRPAAGIDATPTKPKTPASKVKTGNNAQDARKTSKEVDLEKKAWVRRKSKPQNEVEEEFKHVGTPKKRVVSDGHWRRDRPPPIATPEKDDAPLPPITVRRSVASVGLKVPPSIQDFVEEAEQERARRRRLRSRSRSRQRGDITPDYEDSGTRVYIKHRPRGKTLGEDLRPSKSSDTSSYTASSFDKSRSSTDLTTPGTSPTKAPAPRPSTAPRERTSGRSLRKEDDPVKPVRSPRLAEDGRGKAVKQEEEKRSSPSSTPKPYFPPPPKAPGTRIDNWLASTSDPFVEPSLAPEPLSISGKHSRTSTDEIPEADDTHRRSSNRRRRSRPSLDPVDVERSRKTSARSPLSPTEEVDRSESSTPTLQRRGARRTTQSPVKERGSRSSTPRADDITATLDDASPLPSSRQSKNTMGTRPHTKRLSTIASADTLKQSDYQDFAQEGSVITRLSDGDDLHRGTSLKRRMTKHSDLISVLSLPRAENKGIASARSIRTQRARADSATIPDIMNEVTTDELKYQRELRTLVDGVIPVLLQNVLSGSKSSSSQDSAATQPIVNMGIALERLKAAHKRIPMHDAQDLVHWAQQTAKVYTDYLQAWRLGFQNIVVNLAPAEGAERNVRTVSLGSKHNGGSGDGGDGERVDVAYLLKRPLVRLKYLAKTFKTINQLTPSASVEDMAARYQDLVTEARKRANDERARLEDEAASSIDPTRARDMRSLAPLSGVRIDPTRSVRARDYFDLDMRHASGQQLTCKIEIVIRDDQPGRGDNSDLLFCEVSTTGRWLLFPPVLVSMVSARSGKKNGELVVMVRGFQASGREWRELMSLQSDDDGAVPEWLDMLPASPVPPSLMKKSSFDMLKTHTMSGGLPSPSSPSYSPREIDVPIGERAKSGAPMWDGSDVNSTIGDDEPRPALRRAKATRHRSTPSSPLVRDASRELDEEYAYERTQPRHRPASTYTTSTGYGDRPTTSLSRSTTDWTTSSGYTTPKKDYSVWMPSSQANSSDEESVSDDDRPPPSRPSMHRRTSSVPSMDMPNVNKLRKHEQPTTPPSRHSGHQRSESTPQGFAPDPSSAPAKLQKRQRTPTKDSEKPPAPPAHTRPTSLGFKSSILPSFTPAFLKRHRRSSSPLKHEYEPSTASETLSESDYSDIDDGESITSESSAELPDEQISTIGELKAFPTIGGYKPMAQKSPPESQYSPSDPSLAPSQSASQAPYRTVPVYDDKAAKTVASIFAWADTGSWDSLHPEECCIVVSPGLIEAFDLAQAQAAAPMSDADKDLSPSTRGVKPLVALELTPLVPLRRGTALDISIRSPPSANSLYRPGANVMFRSPTAEDCESLYQLINRARINNPTYIALQNARGPMQTSNWGEAMDRRNDARNNSGWFGIGSRKGSYRSQGSRRISATGTDSSVGTVNSAFSALRRFSGTNRIFNIAKSTITSREGGSGSTYSDSLDSGAATPLPIDPSLGTPLGLTNMKIRLYTRESASKWRDMGSARLTIMLPPRPDPNVPADPRTTGQEKRVIINGKTKGETLMDATLGESCFERVARTGIAVSVWEENLGPNGELGHVGAVGGVVGARAKVYMIQMKSERDTAYTFSLVGKLRY